ncbi:hypothetical protein [Nocardia bhagyanarayanae]|nr:hypothetical protein [Nocardia bhagyanarayanae]
MNTAGPMGGDVRCIARRALEVFDEYRRMAVERGLTVQNRAC